MQRIQHSFVFGFLSAILGITVLSPIAVGQDKSKVETALSYKPVQRDVEIDLPTKEEIKDCKIESSLESFGEKGFVVTDGSGRVLRLFLDTNRDSNLDTWSYFRDGIEVYRDADMNFDGRADTFRWMGSSGMRHGVDKDNNGTIDQWLKLSASELAEEVFHSVRTSDTARFKNLLVSSDELKSLDLGESMTQKVATSIREAAAKFESFCRSQKAIDSRSTWTQFGNSRPNLVPKGQLAVQRDLITFDHAAAVFENKGQFGQISLGTIVEVEPNNWRLLELPEVVSEGEVVQNGGLFFPAFDMNAESQVADNGNPQSKALVELYEKYDLIEKSIAQAKNKPAELARFEQQRAELFMQLAEEIPDPTAKKDWIRQMADTVTSSFQTGSFPRGLEFLEEQIPRLTKIEMTDQIPYLRWRMIYARFSQHHDDGDRRARNEASERYISDLEKFVKDFPKDSFAADATFQLGLNAEVTDREDLDKATGWYTQCRESFGNTLFGKKAAGALLRLSSQGKTLPLSGTTLDGKPFDLQSADLRGKIIVVHYWETWCDTCIEGFEELQRLGAKYKSDLMIVGANLDTEASKAKDFLSKNRSVNWTQLHSPGGVEKSPLSVQLGIATLPMTLLIDQRGKLVESNLPVDDLDREIQRLIRRESGQANLQNPTR
jgi:thiol-disulfide isomerase/thioredoxin